MKKHKYFLNKEEYNEWVKCNPKAIVTDIKELDRGMYIYYIHFKASKIGRIRRW